MVKYDWKDKTILMIDNDEISNLLIKALLEDKKCNLLFANNGIDALKLLNDRLNIDLVLIELNLPGINGYEVITNIKDDLPIIIQTTLYYEKENCIEFGCEKFITKPLDFNILLKLIDSCIGDY